MATVLSVPGLPVFKRAYILTKMSVAPAIYWKTLEKVFKGSASQRDSPSYEMKYIADKATEGILAVYDATRSNRSDRRTNKLRSLIKRDGPYMDNAGNIKVYIARDVASKAPYWNLLEFGVPAKTRRQWFRIAGTGGRGDKRNKFKRRVRKRRGKVVTGETSFSYGAVVSGGSIKRNTSSRTQFVSPKIAAQVSSGGLKLYPLKKGTEGRVKNKILIEYQHRGIRPGGFFQAGINWLNRDGIPNFVLRLNRVIHRVNMETNQAVRSQAKGFFKGT